MKGPKLFAAIFLTGAAILAASGCHTTVIQPVERPVPDHHDDHHDDRNQPPPPDRHDDRH